MRKDTFGNVIEMLPAELRDEITKLVFSLNDKKTGKYGVVSGAETDAYSSINEIRIRSGQACSYRIHGVEERVIRGSVIVDNYLLNETINKFINYSYYAYEEELKNGYITLFGGHRAGICGRAVIDGGRVSLINNISSVNIRHAREYIGISESFMERIFGFKRCSSGSDFNSGGSFRNPERADSDNEYLKNTGDRTFPSTLIVSPPGCGKTTFIRDMIRALSLSGLNIGVCDERSEIAGMYLGKPSFEIGPNTDVMDACPKAEGMRMLLRSMAPDIIATDEIGKSEDVEALKAALASGTGIIATMHGSSMEDLKTGELAEIVEAKIFKKIVFLSKDPRPCTIREVYSIK